MTKSELIRELSERSGVPKPRVANLLSDLEALVIYHLKAGGEITLPGIGKLTIKDRAAREGRNPATGATITIPARSVPHISFATSLKDAVAAG